MRRIALGYVEQVSAGQGRTPLDFSVRSLRIADLLVRELRADGAEQADVAPQLFGLGAYVGEVIVRNAGAAWVDLDSSQQKYFRQWVGVRMADGMTRSPLGTVSNRFGGGFEESLEIYYLTLPGRVRARSAA
ncbi:hypothetical protein [Streptomyces sp. NPDC051561]|uniref:hypothetical protein n=1 Tax=Streptomyces sp. NPDC051561 TaxID=3365658 RepID=UPI00379E8D31